MRNLRGSIASVYLFTVIATSLPGGAQDAYHPIIGAKPLSVLGIERGENFAQAFQSLFNAKYTKSPCFSERLRSRPEFHCLVRGSDERVTLWSLGGKVKALYYDFSGSKYDSVWRSLAAHSGNPHAVVIKGGGLFDFWKDDRRHDAILIQKIVGGAIAGTGTAQLEDTDALGEWPSLITAENPNQFSDPIDGMLTPSTAQATGGSTGGLLWSVNWHWNAKLPKPFSFRMRQTKAEVTEVLLRTGYWASSNNKNALKCDGVQYDVEICKTVSSSQDNDQEDYFNLEFRHGRLTHVEWGFRPDIFKPIASKMLDAYGSKPPQLVYGSESSPQYYWVLPNAEITLSKDTATGWSVVQIKDNSDLTNKL